MKTTIRRPPARLPAERRLNPRNPGWKAPPHRGRRASVAVALAGLLCLVVPGGDRQFGAVLASVPCSNGSPGDLDFCASSVCGPCLEGEGDCDPGQCAAGLSCAEEGGVDHCRTDGSCSSANPGASNYCASSVCGPCGEGEGDCDPGQCASGLECVEEGSVDRCRAGGTGSSNLQVHVDGAWEGVCCIGGIPQVSGSDCFFTEYDRRLTDETAGLELDCPEGSPTDCDCDGSGERMHGINGSLDSSLLLWNGGPVFPNFGEETCVYVKSNGELATEWTNSGCPDFRLQ